MDITYDLWGHLAPKDRFCLLTRLFQMAQEYSDLYRHLVIQTVDSIPG
jgi:hypothetical protein